MGRPSGLGGRSTGMGPTSGPSGKFTGERELKAEGDAEALLPVSLNTTSGSPVTDQNDDAAPTVRFRPFDPEISGDLAPENYGTRVV